VLWCCLSHRLQMFTYLFVNFILVCVADCSASLLLCSFISRRKTPNLQRETWTWSYIYIYIDIYINVYLWTLSEAVSLKKKMVSRLFWNSEWISFTFVDVKSCAAHNSKADSYVGSPAVLPLQGLLLISVFLSWSFWGIIEPEPHQLKTRTVPLVLYGNPHPPHTHTHTPVLPTSRVTTHHWNKIERPSLTPHTKTLPRHRRVVSY